LSLNGSQKSCPKGAGAALIVVALNRSFFFFFKVVAVNGLAFSGLASALEAFCSADFPAPLTVLFWIGMASTLSSRFRETAEFE
jgi:hypothetical protein